MSTTATEGAPVSARCANCGTELAPAMLACPACHALVHALRLKELAAAAEASAAAGDLAAASQSWQHALDLLPPTSQQYAVIQERVTGIAKQLAAQPSDAAAAVAAGGDAPWYKRGGAALIAVVVLLLSKIKFLILGLTKASTFFSMFAFFGLYWNLYGWPLALGLVVSIYIHEMGHVAMLKRMGISAGAPLFIPGVGALVLLKQRITDPAVDAKVGLAGPVWGLGAGLAAYAVFLYTRIPVWGAIAALTGFINLFNLIPVWQLDGSRGFHALASWQRVAVVLAIAAAFYLTAQKMLLIIGAVAVWRAFQRTDAQGDMSALGTFVLLVFALAWLSVSHSI